MPPTESFSIGGIFSCFLLLQGGEHLLKNYIKRARVRASQLNSDEWIITSVLLAVILPDALLAALIIAVGLFIFISPARRRKIAAQPAFYITLLMLPVIMLPAVLAGNVTGLIYGAFIWFVLVFMLYVSANTTLWFTSNLMDILLLLSVVSAVVGLIQLPLGIRFLGRIPSIYDNPNYYGYAIEIFILAALYQYSHKGKSIYLFLAAGNLLCNLMCDCRTALPAIALSATVFIFMKLKKAWLLGIAAAAAALFTAVLRLIPSLAPRLSMEALMRSLANRTRYWGNAAEWFLQKPVFGYGASGYSMLSEAHGEKVLVHAHNLPLNILLDFGIVGMTAFIALVLRLIFPVFRKQEKKTLSDVGYLIISVLIATLVHGITDVPIFGVSSALMFVTLLGTVGCYGNEYASIRAKRTKRAASITHRPTSKN